MSWLPVARRAIHRRYLRAAATGASLALIGLSLGALGLRMRHDVTLGAVVRYFTRGHHGKEDLTPLFRSRATAIQIARLADPSTGVELGGLVYADDGHLVFYPHAPRRAQERRERLIENRAVYARLLPLYRAAAVGELLRELRNAEIQAELRARGLDPAGLVSLEDQLQVAASEADRIRLLRLTALFIQPFGPTGRSEVGLDLGEKLRFYQHHAPAGAFVGQFVVLDARWDQAIEPEALLELSRHSHFILLRRSGRRIEVADYFRGRARGYSIEPFDHLSGSTLYRLATAG